MNTQHSSDIYNVDSKATTKKYKNKSSSSPHKLPNKYLVFAYIIWLIIHTILFISVVLEGSSEIFDIEEFYPWSDGLGATSDYDVFEFIFYCGMPLLIYRILRRIENKYYTKTNTGL